MFIFKEKKVINFILLLSVLLFLLIYLLQFYDYNKQNSIIKKGNVDYIYIEKIKIKRILKKDFDINLLNQGYVGYKYIGSNLMVVGHAIEQVFQKIDRLDNGDIVDIKIDNVLSKYKVIDKYVISINDFNIYEYQDSMILVTCDLNKNKRKIVVTKKLT